MTVLRRLDAVLEPTKQAVLDMKATLDGAGIVQQDQALRQAAGQAFYNTSRFTLRDLRSRASQQQLRSVAPGSPSAKRPCIPPYVCQRLAWPRLCSMLNAAFNMDCEPGHAQRSRYRDRQHSKAPARGPARTPPRLA
jgi:hypothetical protein